MSLYVPITGNYYINDKFVEIAGYKKILQYFVQSLTENEIILADNTRINIGDRIECRIGKNPVMKGTPYPMKREGLSKTYRAGILLKIDPLEKTLIMADICDPNDGTKYKTYEIIDIKKMS